MSDLIFKIFASTTTIIFIIATISGSVPERLIFNESSLRKCTLAKRSALTSAQFAQKFYQRNTNLSYLSDDKKRAAKLRHALIVGTITAQQFLDILFSYFYPAQMHPNLSKVLLYPDRYLACNRVLTLEEDIEFVRKRHASQRPFIAELLNEPTLIILDSTLETFYNDQRISLMSPKEMLQVFYEITRSITNLVDIYKEPKDKSNNLALANLQTTYALVEQQLDPLVAAVKVSIEGNDIDYTHAEKAAKLEKEGWDTQQFIQNALAYELRPPFDNYHAFRDKIRQRRDQKILFLTDNAGEVIFDFVLIKQLLLQGHNVIIASRRFPVANDVTEEELGRILNTSYAKKFFGEDINRITVIDSGFGFIGVYLPKATDKFITAWYECDFVISKGEGNLDGLWNNSLTKDVFYLFKAKSPSYYTITKPTPQSMCLAFRPTSSPVETSSVHVRHALARRNTRIAQIYFKNAREILEKYNLPSSLNQEAKATLELMPSPLSKSFNPLDKPDSSEEVLKAI